MEKEANQSQNQIIIKQNDFQKLVGNRNEKNKNKNE